MPDASRGWPGVGFRGYKNSADLRRFPQLSLAGSGRVPIARSAASHPRENIDECPTQPRWSTSPTSNDWSAQHRSSVDWPIPGVAPWHPSTGIRQLGNSPALLSDPVHSRIAAVPSSRRPPASRRAASAAARLDSTASTSLPCCCRATRRLCSSSPDSNCKSPPRCIRSRPAGRALSSLSRSGQRYPAVGAPASDSSSNCAN